MYGDFTCKEIGIIGHSAIQWNIVTQSPRSTYGAGHWQEWINCTNCSGTPGNLITSLGGGFANAFLMRLPDWYKIGEEKEYDNRLQQELEILNIPIKPMENTEQITPMGFTEKDLMEMKEKLEIGSQR